VSAPIGLSRDANHIYTANYDGQIRVVPGVTGVLRVLDKPAIVPWAQKITATAAIERRHVLDEWVQVGGVEAAIDLLRKAADNQRDKAGDVGSEVHNLADALNKGIPVTVPEDLAAFVEAYQRWVQDLSPKFLASEEMVFSEAGYAGTLDSIAVIGGETWLLDIKTAAKGPWPETALQLAAYASADFIGRPNDPAKYAIPKIDQYGVVKVRPEGAQLYPFDVTAVEVDAFRAVLAAHAWRSARTSRLIGQPVGPALLNFAKEAIA
jgi:hypothetical protein